MSAGCFSWCPRWFSKKQITETIKSDEKLPENRQAIDPATKSIVNQVMEMKLDEELSENKQSVAPTTAAYITASGKQLLTMLQSAAAVIPVPLLQDAIGVAITIIQVCEEVSAVEQKVKELQRRIGHLMVVIVDHVTAMNEDGSKERFVEAVKHIEKDIEALLGTLKIINKDLMEISAQNRWLTGVYKDLNTNTLEDCMNRLETALERFTLANDLRDSDLLQKLQSRLDKIHGLMQQMAKKVDNIDGKMDNIDGKMDNMGGEIHEVLSRLKRSATLLSSEAVVRQEIPLRPEVFYGRDDLVEDIGQLLMKEETSRICILGPGGMGKTSVSLAVVELRLVEDRFPLGNRVWVPCIEATSATRFLEILHIQLQVPGDKQVTLPKILSKLDASKQPHLLLLDNFETPWNGPDKKQVEDILRQIAKLSHIAIIVTMRGSHPPCDKAIKWQSRDIQPADEASCFRIYRDVNPGSENDPDVGELLSTLGYMPFAVTLMANLGKDGQSTAKVLLDAWSKSGPDILPDQEQSMNRSISLSVDSNLVKQNPNALLLLKILSLLPAGTITENLHWWAPALDISMIPSAIATLSNAALLVKNKRQDTNSPVLFVLPVVQSFMQQHDRIAEEIRMQIQSSCCQYVLDHACRYDDSTFPIKSKALAAEVTNIQSILCGPHTMEDDISSNRTLETLIAFSWHYCDTKPNLEIANRAVTAAKASGIERYTASAVWCLGRTYYLLNDYRLSYNHLQDAYQLFNTLPSDDLDLRRLGGQCGIDLVRTSRVLSQKTLLQKTVSLARDVEAKCAALSDDLIHGQSLVFLGLVLDDGRQFQEALRYLDRAKIMLKAVGNSANLATACHGISSVNYHEQRLPEALDAVEEASKNAELSDSPYIQAVVSLHFSKILFSANRDTEVWKYLEIGLMKASYVGSWHSVAMALEYMGYGYLRRGDYQNAYGAYEAAAEKYLITDHAQSEMRCKSNMASIKRKQGDPGADVGFHRPSHCFEKDFFYPPVQVSAE